MNEQLTGKRALIDKANARVMIAVSIAAFLIVFSAVSTKTLMSQAAYQNRVITAKEEARDILKKDIESAKKLKISYEKFVNTSVNALGGSPVGAGTKDGDNAKIILDALPSSYDFPALATSLEIIASSQNVNIKSIEGVDEEVNQATNSSSSSPQPIAIPFDISVSSDYQKIQDVVSSFEKSIRPIKIKTLDITVNQQEIILAVSAETFFQPAKSLNISKQVVK